MPGLELHPEKTLTLAEIEAVARKPCGVSWRADGRSRVERSAAYVEEVVRSDLPCYGVNTGFGVFADKRLSPERAAIVSRNLVLSHAVGCGPPFPLDVVRAAMLIRANTLALGWSGVRPILIETLLRMLEGGVHPLVPEKGSLGSSGDLAPLAHLALVFTASDPDDGESGQALVDGRVVSGETAMRRAGIPRFVLGAKEALGLTNGATFSAALCALAIQDARKILEACVAGTCLAFEALLGLQTPLDERIHQVRGHQGQKRIAAAMREWLAGSTMHAQSKRVQDAYSLRCSPQILGPVLETLDFVTAQVEQECNAATDNPLFFGGDGGGFDVLSGGNFHGQILAMAADFSKIAIAEAASLAEQQINRMLSAPLSAGLPAMLVGTPGAEGESSGLMMSHYTAASLVLDSRSLCHPDATESLPTSAGQEDHNANALNAARHLASVVANTRRVVATQILVGCQALELRLRAGATAAPSARSGELLEFVRQRVPLIESDQAYAKYIDEIEGMIQNGDLPRPTIA